MKTKKLGTVAAVIAAVGLVGAAPANAKLKRINIGSNPAGSVYFLLAGGFAKMFQKQTKIRSVAQPHAGSSVYLPLMDVGEIVLGINSSLDSGMAFNGKAPFKQRHLGVKSLARVWILPYGYMTKESSGIKTIADFKGKRIVVNFRTNVSLGQLNRTILGTAGLTMNDIKSVVSGGVSLVPASAVSSGSGFSWGGLGGSSSGADGQAAKRKSQGTLQSICFTQTSF